MLLSTPNSPAFGFDHLPLHWQMTRCEKYAFTALLELAKADVAIEIGTYKGGSLQQVSKNAKKVYSLDIMPSCKEDLGPLFPNVEFLTGDSKPLVASVLKTIEERNEKLGFVLIDGDHSTDGVRGDINAVLKHVPTRDVYIVFHDSFNPEAREGILSADWQACPYVHFVEVDYVPGVFHHKAFDTAAAGSMYGGLAVAIMKPEKRNGDLIVHESQRGLYDAVYQASCYVTKEKPSFIRRVKRSFSKVA